MPAQATEPHAVMTKARDDLYAIRRELELVRAALVAAPSNTVNSARQDLCAALVRRLEIAENEAQQLLDMLEIGGK